MAHNKYTPPGKTHEKKTTHKERKEQRKDWEANRQPTEQVQVAPQQIEPTVEDKDQLRRLSIIAGVVVVALLFFMYYMFAWK